MIYIIKLEEYKGKNILNRLTDPYKKEVYSINWEQLYVNYGDNVDFQKLKNQVLLCEETRDILYSQPKAVKYIHGKRPELERVVKKNCHSCLADREKVIALMCYCRDLYKKHPGEYQQLFYGGTEEELIKKGEWLCECLGGRLMIGLCEIAGIPGRSIMHVASGHITSELYFDKKWAYVDPRCGLFYLNKAGEFASVDELVHNRELIKNQSKYVKSFVSSYWNYSEREEKNYYFCMNPEEIQCYAEYSLMDKDNYNYEWKTVNAAIQDGLYIINKRYKALTNIILKK